MSIKPAHAVSYSDLQPGDEVIIAFKNASINGGLTEGRVTVVSVGDQVIRVQWPDDPPGRSFAYSTSILTKLERED